MNKLLIVSYDSVGDGAFDQVASLPNTAAFLRESALTREVRSVFLTNTYPVHASIVTGVPPARHGLISNVQHFPYLYPRWNYNARDIKVKTLWQELAARGGTVASAFWPVTCGAREIRWHIPEIVPRPQDNTLFRYLTKSTLPVIISSLIKYGNLLNGAEQPALDRFTTACMRDLLRRKRPDLALAHLTAYDALCHIGGPGSAEADTGIASLDESLGALLEAAGPEYRVIVFSDHSQLAVEKELFPNDMLVEEGLLAKDAEGNYSPLGAGCFIDCCGGAAFFHAGSLGAARIEELKAKIAASEGFKRFLTAEEIAESGMTEPAFSWCYLPGFCCAAGPSGYKGQHGYPADYPGYKVFYAVRAPEYPPGALSKGGSLLDIAPLARKLLGF